MPDDRFGAATYAKCAHFNRFLEKHSRFRRDCYATGFGSSLKSMRQLQCDIRKEAKTMIEQYQADNRGPTDREDARLNELAAVLGDLDASIDGRVEDMDRERNLPVISYGDNSLAGDHSPSRVLPTKAGGRRMAELFRGQQLSSDGFRDMSEFLRSMRSGMFDNRMQAASNEERDGFGSGYLVPGQFLGSLLDSSLETEIVRSRADVLPMSTNEADAPSWDNLDHSASIGGLTGEWLGQSEPATAQAAKFRNIRLVAKKLAIYCQASNELVEDASTFEQQLQRAMIAAIGWHLDRAFFVGTGAGQPLGVLNDPALVTVAKESAQAADTIRYANLAKMFARLHPASLPKSVWVCNSTCIPQLLQLFATDGTTSTHVPVLTESNGAFSMLTRPCVFTEKLPLLGDVGDIVLCDFSQYVGLRKEGVIERSQHIGWMTDTASFRLKLRCDGKGKWSSPFTPKNGSTLSWCVTLAERA